MKILALSLLLILLLLVVTSNALAGDRDPLIMEPLGSWPAGPGESITLCGNYILCGEGGLLRIFQRYSNEFGDEIGELRVAGTIHEISLDGSLAYLAVRDVGLVVVDVNSGVAPTVLATLVVPGGGQCVDVADDLVAVGREHLYLVDVSDPAAPVLLATESFSSVLGVDLDGDVCHVADGLEGYALVDVSDPTAPAVLGRHTAVGGLHAVAAVDELVYAGSMSDGVAVLDVSDPASIVLLGTADSGRVKAVAPVGDRLYASGSSHILQIYSLADPTQPVLLGEHPNWWGQYVAIAGQFAFVASLDAPGFAVIACGNPASPEVIDSRSVRGYIRWIDVEGDIAMVTGSRYYVVLDISDPTHPVHLSQFDTGPEPNRVIIEGDLAYCHSGIGLDTYDLSDPTDPAHLGYDLAYHGTDAAKIGDIVYSVVNEGIDQQYLRAFDVSDPTAPQELYTTLLTTTMHINESMHITTRDNLLLAYGFNLGCWLFDVTDPNWPQLLAIFHPQNDPVSSTAIGDGYLYLQYSHDQELRIYDIADPANPQLVATHPYMPYSRRAFVEGNLLLSAGQDYGVFVHDISDPLQPILVGSFNTPGRAYDLKYHDGNVYVADFYVGLQILSLDLGPVATLIDGFQVVTAGYRFELSWRYFGATPDRQRLTADYFQPGGASVRRELTIRVDGSGQMAATDASRELSGSATVRYVLWSSDDGDFWQPVAEHLTDAPASLGRLILHPATPNPFNPSTRLAFELAHSGPVRLDILDARGRLVRTMVNGDLVAGRHEMIWDGRDDLSRNLASGVYFSRLKAGSLVATGKLTLVE